MLPTSGHHRGWRVHAFQTESRIAQIVMPAIDNVIDRINAPADLLAYARNAANPPEARIIAGDKYRALYELSAEAHTARSVFNLELMDAHLAGVESLKWCDPSAYCAMLDTETAGVAPRPADQAALLLAAQESAPALNVNTAAPPASCCSP